MNERIDEMFKDLDNSSIKSCTIFKVNVWQRESNPDAYTPKMISMVLTMRRILKLVQWKSTNYYTYDGFSTE